MRKKKQLVVDVYLSSIWKGKELLERLTKEYKCATNTIMFIPTIRLLAHPSCSTDCLEMKDVEGRTPIMVAVQAMFTFFYIDIFGIVVAP